MSSNSTMKSAVNVELFEAASNGSVEGVSAALRKGGDPNYFHHPEDQKNSLHVACEHGYLDVVKLVLQHGAFIDAIAAASQATPLILAAQSGKEVVVAYLISKGAQVNLVNGYGNSALHTACRFCFTGVVKQLVEAGANCRLKNHKGSSPLHFCGYSGSNPRESRTLIKLLIDHGADLDEKDTRGNTPLLTACIGGNAELMDLLIEMGAQKGARNESKEGILELAKFYNHLDIVRRYSNEPRLSN